MPKRTYAQKGRATKRRRAATGKRWSAWRSGGVTPGYTRRVGFYGRFGSSGKRGARAPERKFLDTATAFNFDTTPEVPATGQLALVPQGATESQRVGRKIMVKSIQWKWRCAMASATVPVALATFYVVQDTQCNGTAAAFGDVFTGSVCGTGMRNLSNSNRFRILATRTVKLQNQAGVAAGYAGDVTQTTGFIRCNIPMEFNGATGAITEIKSNNIFLLAGCDVNLTGEDDAIGVQGNVRITYTDI